MSRRRKNNNQYEKNLPKGDQIEGRNPLEEALAAGRKVHHLFVLEKAKKAKRGDPLFELKERCREQGAKISYADRNKLDSLAKSAAHQGIIAFVEPYQYADLSEILQSEEAAGRDPFLILLDNLQDSHNLGAILRVADAAGVTAVVIPRHRSVSLNAAVAKTSAGAIEYVPVCQVTNLTQTVLKLKESGFWIYGSSDSAQDKYYDLDWSGKVALVIGNEGEGMGKKLQEHCDFLLTIPQKGEINSLNASVACGIITFEAMRQRGF